jgi:hypothetical protein
VELTCSQVRISLRQKVAFSSDRSLQSGTPLQTREGSRHSPWDRCYVFLNIFAENFSEKIGVFDSKQS